MKQQTAVQWLADKLLNTSLVGLSSEIDLIHEAIKKEEEQIKQAYGDGLNAHRTNFSNRDEYFNQTYQINQ